MSERFQVWLWQALIAVDQCCGVLFFGPFYALFGGEPVHADETISSRVGRGAETRKWWGLALELPINGLFWLLGDGWDHCRRNIEPQFRVSSSAA